MPDRGWSRTPIRIATFALPAALVLACSGDEAQRSPLPQPPASPAAALRAAFPAHAADVLEGGVALVPADGGFATAPPPAARGAWIHGEALFPESGDGAVRIGAGGFSVRVRERGASGRGAIVGATVAYPREGGTSFWRAAEDGFEEWLHLGPRSEGAGSVVAAWDVEGATPVPRAGGVDLVDPAGIVRLRVTAPRAYAASGRAVPVALTAEGGAIELRVDAGDEPVLVDPMWSMAGAMVAGCAHHTATEVANGVLVAGGDAAGVPLSTVQVYNGTWAPAASMATARTMHTATVVAQDPSVLLLVAGGSTAGGAAVASAEIFSEQTGAWTPAPSMAAARSAHTATSLGTVEMLFSGGVDVLVAGGVAGGAALASAEVYGAAGNAWTTVSPMAQARSAHAAVRLASGRVLVAGGVDAGTALASAEVFDPATSTWRSAPPMAHARWGHTATLLVDGKVLVAGGTDGAPIAAAELYDPTTDTWAPAGSEPVARSGHAAALLVDGTVLVAGGTGGSSALASADVYDPKTSTWSPTAPLAAARTGLSLTTVFPGKVLAAGGSDGAPVASSELYAIAGLIGDSCSTATDCVSGFCVGGVCCNTACNLACDTSCTRYQPGVCTGGFCQPLFPSVPCICPGFQQGWCNPGSCGCNCGAPPLEPLGAPCTSAAACASGFCAYGVCCDSACNLGECGGCTVPGGSPADGTCTPYTGAMCANGTCQAGVCVPEMDGGAGGAGSTSSSSTTSSTSTSGGAGGAVTSSSASSTSSGAATSSSATSTSSGAVTSSSSAAGGSGGGGSGPGSGGGCSITSARGHDAPLLPPAALVGLALAGAALARRRR
jgi:hypothetical protein